MKNISVSALSIRGSGFFSLISVGFCTLTACQQLPQKATVDFAEPKVTPAAMPTVPFSGTTGSLFQKAGYNPVFEDSRARRVGDIVTINVEEKLTAAQDSTSKAEHGSKLSTGIPTPPLAGIIGPDVKNLEMGITTTNNSTGTGGSTANNNFKSFISATVIEVLPNGHLVVAGEKQIGVNQSVDVIRFSGTINPRMLAVNNTIDSKQVANLRVESRTRGAQGEVHSVGLLSRLLFSFNPF